MSKWRSNFTITTLSSSIDQRTLGDLSIRSPFWFGITGERTLRGGCQEYTQSDRDCAATGPPIPPIPSQSVEFLFLSSLSVIYAPNIDYNQTVTFPQISGSVIYTPEVLKVLQEVTFPRIGTASVYTPNFDHDLSITFPQLSPSVLYQPTLTATSLEVNSYTQVMEMTNSAGTTSRHVGSIYLDARTYTTIGALINDVYGGMGGSNVYAEFKRFTNGSSLVTLEATNTAGNPFQYITASSVVVSTADWYDVYISASGAPAVSSIRGIYYEYP